MTRSRRAEGGLVGDRPDDEGDDAPADLGASAVATAREAPAGDADPGHAEASTAAAGDRGDGGDRGGDRSSPSARRVDRAARVGVAVALALPIVIAAIAVRSPKWYPQVDLSQIEMRVRDVFSPHPPTVGLGGRISGLNTQGAHPGPLSFYLLAPVYRLFGSTSWAMQVSEAVLNVAVVVGTLWATGRRWGLRGVLLIAAALAFLMHLYGVRLLVSPWNPYMPVLFWVLFLVCVWGVLSDDLPLLPIAVVTGSLCAQTHISYVGLVGGLMLVIVVSLVQRGRRARGDAAARLRRWAGGSALLGVVLWSPVLIQELGGNPGNLSIIWDGFVHKRDPAIGYSDGWGLLVRRLDVTQLLGAGGTGSPWVGAGLLVAWAVATVVAARRRDRDLTSLNLVVGVALALGLVNAANIMGIPWDYLSLWGYGTAGLAAVAVVATVARIVGSALATRGDAGRWRRLSWVPTAALVVAITVPLAPLLRDAPSTNMHDQEPFSAEFAEVIGPTVAAIEDGTVSGGPGGTFLVSWSDPVSLGGPGFALVLELERRGYDAGPSSGFRRNVRDHRVLDDDEADAVIHVAFGVGAVEQARLHPGAREIAFFDPRSDTERQEYADLRARVVDGLVAADLEDEIPELDRNMLGLAVHPDLPDSVREPLHILGQMPQPIAVLVWEPGS